MTFLATKKYFCRSCGWHLVKTQVYVSVIDAITAVDECPRCKSRDIDISEASLLESMSPVESLRAAAHGARKAIGALRRPR